MIGTSLHIKELDQVQKEFQRSPLEKTNKKKIEGFNLNFQLVKNIKHTRHRFYSRSSK